MNRMQRNDVRVLVLWALVLTALYFFQNYFS